MTEPRSTEITRYAQQRTKRSRARKIALLVLLLILLLLLVWWALYYAENRVLLPGLSTDGESADAIQPPQFLYSISGPEGADSLTQPVGLAVDTARDRVFVVDARDHTVRCYDTDGAYNFSFRAIESAESTALALPGRATIGPDGNLWVTDRRLGVFVFDPEDGSFVREFVPNGEIADEWGPIAIAFDAKGNLYIADAGQSEHHRVLVFDTAGNEIRRWGDTVQTKNVNEAPGNFYYPNGFAFDKAGNVFVSDMNNHRIQVFSPEGEFKYLIPSMGSPIGLAMDAEERLYAVDPFAHTVDVYKAADGKRLTGFGEPGRTLGRFSFPADIGLDEANGHIFVTDRENNQVQVWGWPSGIIPPIVIPEKPVQWAACLSPLLLLLIPLLRRRTAFMATPDFLDAMIAIEGAVPKMDDRRFKWVVTEAVYAQYERRTVEGVDFGDLLDGQPYSRTDVEDFMEKSGADEATAIVLTMAERIGRLATESGELAKAAEALEIRVVDARRFLAEYADRRGRATARRGGRGA